MFSCGSHHFRSVASQLYLMQSCGPWRSCTGVVRETILSVFGAGSTTRRCYLHTGWKSVAAYAHHKGHCGCLPAHLQGFDQLCLDQCAHLSQVFFSILAKDVLRLYLIVERQCAPRQCWHWIVIWYVYHRRILQWALDVVTALLLAGMRLCFVHSFCHLILVRQALYGWQRYE